MAFDPFDPDTAIRIGIATTVFFVLVAVVSFIGEVAGWWDLAGEIGMAAGALGSVLVGAATIFAGAGRRQLSGVGDAVLDNGTKLDRIDVKLDKLDRLDRLDKLDKLDELDQLARLEGIDNKLDAAHVSLEAQTGVLNRQATILTQIRDGLAASRRGRSGEG